MASEPLQTATAIEDSIFIKKVDQFTYGLLYPAFFGNMIYDLVQAKTEQHYLQGIEFYFALVIVFFYALDYIHLYVDMNSIVKKRTGWYIFCDFATSLLFFFSLVTLKYHHPGWAISLFSIVPVLIASYKWSFSFSQTDMWVMVAYGITSLILLSIVLKIRIFHQVNWFFALAIVELLFYIWYVFFFYRNPSQKK